MIRLLDVVVTARGPGTVVGFPEDELVEIRLHDRRLVILKVSQVLEPADPHLILDYEVELAKLLAKKETSCSGND